MEALVQNIAKERLSSFTVSLLIFLLARAQAKLFHRTSPISCFNRSASFYKKRKIDNLLNCRWHNPGERDHQRCWWWDLLLQQWKYLNRTCFQYIPLHVRQKNWCSIPAISEEQITNFLRKSFQILKHRRKEMPDIMKSGPQNLRPMFSL